MVELAQDSPLLKPLCASFLGPSLDIEDVAGSKVLALSGRAEVRDVRAPARQLGKNRLLDGVGYCAVQRALARKDEAMAWY
ncbi:MAG: hypothetical protein FWF02_10075 [Micrococcales bacterium]|nr:hypothetical protein [Micrococcales bacterium]MCL2668034.1 hypothetical protein [Micrococcales bacterium]